MDVEQTDKGWIYSGTLQEFEDMLDYAKENGLTLHYTIENGLISTKISKKKLMFNIPEDNKFVPWIDYDLWKQEWDRMNT